MGNVYEALVGLSWLEGDFQRLTDLDQIEYAHWTPAERRSSVGYLRGDNALRCTKFVFVHEGWDYGYSYGGPAPTLGSVVHNRPPWLAQPGDRLSIHEWNPHFRGPMPQGKYRAPPLPPRTIPGREAPRDTATDGRAAPCGPGPAGSSNDRPAPGRTHGTIPGRETPRDTATDGRAALCGPGPAGSSNDRPATGGAHEEAGRTPGDGGAEVGAAHRHRTQHPFDHKDKDTTVLHYIEGHEEPQPIPDKCTVIFMLAPLGEEILQRVVPRSRWPQGHGHIERF